jgi:hypothetical protein
LINSAYSTIRASACSRLVMLVPRGQMVFSVFNITDL